MSAIQALNNSTSAVYCKKTAALPQDVAYVDKLGKTTLGTKKSTLVDWKKKRLHTPGASFAVKDGEMKEIADRLDTLSIKQFTKKNDSQGLIGIDGRVVCASVTTNIHNETERKKEKKSTWIQFKKTTISDEEADFEVKNINRKGKIFYSGCHLIDHKYCAGNAHKDGDNYFPGNYFYNAPIKETLVQGSVAYLEIPIYTPNPPTVTAKGKNGATYPIPVCVLFVQISKEKIKRKNQVNIYCFPNNSFDYEDLKEKLKLEKDFAKQMIPHFKLNPALYPLLNPAVIYAVQEKQLEKELVNADLMKELMHFDEIEGDIGELSTQVAEGNVSLDTLFEKSAEIACENLQEAGQFAGDYLIRYALRNVLKSEVISITARLEFINSLIDFVEESAIVSEAVFDFYHSFQEEFEQVLKEIKQKSLTLTTKQLLALCGTYFNMTSAFTFPYAMEGGGLFEFEEFKELFTQGIGVLQQLIDKDPHTFTTHQKLQFLDLVHEADQRLILFERLEYDDEVEEEGEFLYGCRQLCEELIKALGTKYKKPSWLEIDYFEQIGFEPVEE